MEFDENAKSQEISQHVSGQLPIVGGLIPTRNECNSATPNSSVTSTADVASSKGGDEKKPATDNLDDDSDQYLWGV